MPNESLSHGNKSIIHHWNLQGGGYQSVNILQVNIQCIRNKILEIEHFCAQENIHVICVSEHWLKDDQSNIFIPSGFVKASLVCRKNKKNGGVAIFLKDGITFSEQNLNNFYAEMDFEICGIKITDLDLYIVSVYRSTSGNTKVFFNLFETALKSI